MANGTGITAFLTIIVVGVIVAVLVVVLTAEDGGGTSTSTSTSTATTATSTRTDTGSAPLLILLVVDEASTNKRDDAYGENPRVIPVGSIVRWINAGTITHHTATSDTGVWDSGDLAPGEQFTRIFDNVGTYPYHCSFHPTMRGTLQVL